MTNDNSSSSIISALNMNQFSMVSKFLSYSATPSFTKRFLPALPDDLMQWKNMRSFP